MDDLIKANDGFDHIRPTSQSGTSDCQMWNMGFGRRQIQRGIVTSLNCQDCNPSSFLVACSTKLSTICGEELLDTLRYQELGGSLFESEISWTVGLWTRLVSEPYKLMD